MYGETDGWQLSPSASLLRAPYGANKKLRAKSEDNLKRIWEVLLFRVGCPVGDPVATVLPKEF